MTLILAHQIDGKLVVVTNGADTPGPKCCSFPHHPAILTGWGDYDLAPTALCCSPSTVPPDQRKLIETNYIGDAFPSLKEGKENFVTAFERELNGSPNVHNGGRGSAALLIAFACDSTIEARVYDANSGNGSWRRRAGALDWPACFGQEHEVVAMLNTKGIKSPTDFMGNVKSIDDFAKRAIELITLTSDYLDAKDLPRSIGLAARLMLISKDGSVSPPKKIA